VNGENSNLIKRNKNLLELNSTTTTTTNAHLMAISRTTRVSRSQNSTILDFTGAKDDGRW